MSLKTYDSPNHTITRLQTVDAAAGGTNGADYGSVRFPYPVVLKKAHAIVTVQGASADKFDVKHGSTDIGDVTLDDAAVGTVKSSALLDRAVPAGEEIKMTLSGGTTVRAKIVYEYVIAASASLA